MSAGDIGDIAVSWLHQVDQLRIKSSKISGRVSGQMRSRILKTQEAIWVLMRRAEAKDNLALLKHRNVSLMDDLRSSKKRVLDLKKELEYAENRVKMLHEEIRLLKTKTGGGTGSPGVARASQTSPGLAEVGGSGDDGREVSIPPLSSAATSTNVLDYMEMVCGMDDRIRGLTELLEDLRKSPSDSRKMSSADRMDRLDDGLGRRTPGKAPVKARIISNIQVAPPRETSGGDGLLVGVNVRDASEHGWTLVGGSRRSRRAKQSRPITPGLAVPSASALEKPAETYADRLRSATVSGAGPPRRKRPPRTVAVAIKSLKEDRSYAEIICKAKDGVSLQDLGIADTRIRRTANGSLLVEIPGPDCSTKADLLAGRLRHIFGEEAAVSRSTIKGELRLVGLDESVSIHEIQDAVVEKGGCMKDEVRVGPIRFTGCGLGVAWVQCPLVSANKISSEGRIRIGWSSVRVEPFRPTQCCRCWKFGHVRGLCKSQSDRSGLCFKCGNPGHTIGNCSAPPRYVLCEERGLRTDHRLGSLNCEARKRPLNSVGIQRSVKRREERKELESCPDITQK